MLLPEEERRLYYAAFMGVYAALDHGLSQLAAGDAKRATFTLRGILPAGWDNTLIKPKEVS